MFQRSSEPSSAPRAPRRRRPSRLIVGLLAAVLSWAGAPAEVRSGELMHGDLLAGSTVRHGAGLEIAPRAARPAARGLPVLRDLLEAPPRVATLFDLPEADGRVVPRHAATTADATAPTAAAATVVPSGLAAGSADPTIAPTSRLAAATPSVVSTASSRGPAFAEPPPPPVLFAAAESTLSDAPRPPTTVVAQGLARRPARTPVAKAAAAEPAPVAQATPSAPAAPAAPKAPVRVTRAASLGVPTLPELAGLPLIDLKDDLGAAAAFERLGTAGLSQSIERALVSSYDVAANASRTRAQRELVDVARGGLLPKLDLRANTGREESKPGSLIDEATGAPVLRSLHTRDDTALVLRQPVWDGSAVGEWSRQKSLYQAAVAGLGSARDQLALDAGGAHLDLLQYRLALQFARDYRTGLEQLFQYVERRAQGGGASAAEAERVKARAINARSTVIEAQGALESALVSYRRLTGGVPDALRTDDLASIRDLPELELALAQARGTNPQIVQLRQTLASIEAEERATIAKLYPKFEIEVGNYRTTNAGGRPGTTDDTRAMFVLNWNLLAGGADLAQLRSIRARQDEAKFRILDLERRLEEALRVTYNTLDAATQRAAAVRDEMTSNERVVAAFQEQLVLANRPLLDVLDSQQRLFQSRAELLRLTALQASLALQIRRQLGGLAPDGPAYTAPPPTVSSSVPSLPVAR
ncbi:MAG: hypothetical protein RJA99_2602 [Pseudomonadota bacterium]|jgi:adhesin transport system outer membrane protein